MDFVALKALLDSDGSTAAMTDQEAADWCNAEVINVDKTSLSNEEILAVILANRAEFTALSDTDKQIVRDILYVGDSVPTTAGEPARDTLVAIFGGGSATITTLAAAIDELVSRAVAWNPPIIGRVRAGDVAYARTLT